MIFISYRRDGGIEFANHLKDSLKKEYDVFFDLDSIRNGKFDEQLYEKIDQADDVIVICSPGALDKRYKEDWMFLEIQRALQLKKNIILVTLPGFEFSNNLDPEIAELKYYQALNASHEYYDAFLDKLKSYLVSKKSIQQKKKTAMKVLIPIAAGILMLSIGIFAATRLMHRDESPNKLSENSSEPAAAEEKSDEAHEGTLLGTFVTVKSDDLSGIPVYNEKGGTQSAATIPEGRACKVTDRVNYAGNEWIYADYCGIKGWVHGDMLRKISSDALFLDLEENPENNIVYVDAESTDLHTEPSEWSGVAAADIPYGEEFEVEEISDGWAKVVHNGEEAYLDMHAADFYCSQYYQVEIGSSKATSIALRDDRSEDAEKIDTIKDGELLQIAKHIEGWGKVTINGSEGWIKMHYLTPCSPDGELFNSSDESD